MNETIIQYRDRIIQYWNKYSKGQKIIFLATVGIIILTIALLTYNFSKTEYQTAFTDLDPSDAAGIKNYLTTSSIPYKLSNDGRSIGVPSTKAAEVKLDIESQGILKNGSLGYGIFKKNMSSFGMTDNEFNVLNLDAKAGEIQQLINSMNGVSSSKVLINLPEQSAFISTDNKEQASASVVVKFKLGDPPNQEKIDTIYNLVTHSIPNLPLENITISDQNGEMFPSSKTNGGATSSDTVIAQQFKVKKQYELEIQKNVQSFLSKFFGQNKVVVSVVASLNFDKKVTDEKLVTPVNTIDQTGIAISVQKIQKSLISDGGQTAGTPGTGQTDVPGYPAGSTSGKTTSEDNESTVNNEVNRISNSIIKSPYVVNDITISAGIEPPKANDPTSLPQATKDEIQKILVNIVSSSLSDSNKTFTDAQLQNKVTIITRSFDGKISSNSGNGVSANLLYGLGALILVLIGGIGFLIMRKRKQQQEVVEELDTANAKPVLPTIDYENVNDNQVRKQLETLAKRKPEDFVNLLRTWLVDE